MPEDTDLPQATVVRRSRTRISVVWIIPILAAAVALGIAVQRILSEGPTITIVFKAAEGLEAGKTLVKYKDVSIGQVTAVRLSPDYSKVEVTAKITKSAEGLMVEDAKFWVVQPRVTLSGVSGLGTLLSGNYVGIEVGKSTKKQRTFIGLEEPLIITVGQPGRSFVLKAANLGPLGVGAPVYYHSLQAGQVVSYSLAGDGKAIELRIFVNAPYDTYVNAGTRFWNASGVDVSVGAGGVEVRTESLVALLAGGVAFDTPAFAAQPEPAAPNTAFTLHGDRATAMKQPESISTRYVLYFDESLRGLSAGAPVTLLGLTAGEVSNVGLDIDRATAIVRGRVEIVTYPDRLLARLSAQQAATRATLARSATERHAFMQRLVEQRGLRAQLRSGNLLTGQLYVAFDHFPDSPKAKIDWSQDVPVLPVTPSTLPDIEAKLTNIVTKLDKLPLEAIGDDVRRALVSVDQVLGNANNKTLPELNATLEETRRALAAADALLKNGLHTTLNEVNTTLEGARRVIATADGVLKNTDATLLGPDAPGQQDLRDALQEVTRAARSLRVLMDYLDRHPESLIRGKAADRP
ncbi:MAG: mammalian cell entry protein [Candidatus Rokuibacteriota bacterium]|nr:MAG: mammalian cell entry protein [Candidatus Rokubacteria bacterium]